MFTVLSAAIQASVIIAEANKYMPRTLGNNHFQISELAAVVENDLPTGRTSGFPLWNEKDELIGQYIAERVPDGACLAKLGIGNIPNAVAKYLTHKKIWEFIRKCYVIAWLTSMKPGKTGNRKKLMPRKRSSLFCLWYSAPVWFYCWKSTGWNAWFGIPQWSPTILVF